MNGFLRRLAERSLGLADTARPIVAPIYGEWRRDAGAEGPAIEEADEIIVAAGRGAHGPDAGEARHGADGRSTNAAPGPVMARSSAPPAPRMPEAPAPSRPTPPIRAPEGTGPPRTAATPAAVTPVVAGAPPAPDVPSRSVIAGPAAPPIPTPAPARRARAADEANPSAAAPVRPAPATSRVAPEVEEPVPQAGATPAPASRATLLPPASAPRVALPSITWRPATRDARAAEDAPRIDARPAEERVVEITIGRVEVRATPQPASSGRPAAPHPARSLEAYLRDRSRGIDG